MQLPPSCTATALRGNTTLTDLMLSHCGINDETMLYLHELSTTIPTLRVLDLSSNRLNNIIGVRHLGKLASPVECCVSIYSRHLFQCCAMLPGSNDAAVTKIITIASIVPRLSP